jgi:multidrug transporter EmrE-like cation transporter
MAYLINLGLLLIYVAASLAGLTMIKAGSGIMDLRMISGLVLYGVGFALWLLMLSRTPLSWAFPLAAGSLIVGTQVSGWLFLAEKMSFSHLLGVGFIVAGVILIAA